MDLKIKRVAVFITRDDYVSTVFIDAVPDEITMSIRSRDLSRHGQELTFKRVSPPEAITVIYEEEPAGLLP